MIDDGTISRLDETTYRMTSADPSLRWLSMNAVGLDVEITEVTDDVAALSFQGPNTRTILNRCCEITSGWAEVFPSDAEQAQAESRSRSRAPATQATWVTRSGWMRRTRCRSGMR